MAANAFHVVMKKNPSAARALADLIFAKQAAFWNKQTADQSANQVQATLSNLLVNAGLISAADFAAGMADGNLYYETVISWKYACSRGVSGTPTFFVNVRTNATERGGMAAARRAHTLLCFPLVSLSSLVLLSASVCPRCVCVSLRACSWMRRRRGR